MEARKQILALVTSVKPEPIAATPAGWPDGLYLRRVTLLERDEIAEFVRSGPKGKNHPETRAYLLARLVCDAGGARVFGDEDTGAIGHLPSDPAYTPITNQALELCGFDVDDDDDDEAPAGNG